LVSKTPRWKGQEVPCIEIKIQPDANGTKPRASENILMASTRRGKHWIQKHDFINPCEFVRNHTKPAETITFVINIFYRQETYAGQNKE